MRMFVIVGVLGVVPAAMAAAQVVTSQAPAVLKDSVRATEMSDALRQYYPSRARAAREQGMVGFIVRLDKAGEPSSCEVTRSSGFRALDDETCPVVLAHAVFKPEVDASGHRVVAVHEGVINWRIAGIPQQPLAAPVAVTAANAPDKMICKRTLRMGTLAGYERTCMKRREWLRITDDTKDPYGQLQGSKGMTTGDGPNTGG
jgi:periplasmic protein TonB